MSEFDLTGNAILSSTDKDPKTLSITRKDTNSQNAEVTPFAEFQMSISGANNNLGDIVFLTNNGSSYDKRMRIDPDGNLGIGTTNPWTSLKIARDSDAPESVRGDAQLEIGGKTNENKVLRLGFETTNNYGFIQSTIWGTSSSALALNPDGGNVGIGTMTPTGHQLDVASYQGYAGNSAIRALYPWGGGLLNTEFAALAHRGGGWTGLYAKQGAASSAAYFDGNVGIGTPSPQAQLQVDASDNTAILNLRHVENGGIWTFRLAGDATTSNNFHLDFMDSRDMLMVRSNGSVGIGTPPNPQLKLDVRGYNMLTDPTTQYNSHFPWTDNCAYITGSKVFIRGGAPEGWNIGLTMDGLSGNVGIGTPGPGYKLTVDIKDEPHQGIVVTDSSKREISLRANNGTGAHSPMTQEGDLTLIFSGGAMNTGALVIAQWSQYARGLRIDSSGNITYSGNLNRLSSREIKENIDDLSVQEALVALEKLNPVKFNLKADEGKVMQVGFIAEEVPHLATTSDGKAIISDHIVAILTKIIKEQQKAITALTEKLKIFEMKIGVIP